MNGWRVKVPGKVMLAGEYSVLHGEKALAATVDAYLTATITKAPHVELNSNLWPQSRVYHHLAELSHRDPFESCVARAANDCNLPPFALRVESELNLEYGIGSSSALRLACIHAIEKFTGNPSDVWQSATRSLVEQRHFQKRASGYDIATQTVGGLIQFQPENSQSIDVRSANRLATSPEELAAIVQPMTGPKGSATSELISQTLVWLEKENRFTELDRRNRNLIAEFHRYFQSQDNMATLIKAASQVRKFFRHAPNFPAWMADARELDGIDRRWTFKMSGAGGEDAVLLIGPAAERRVGEAFFKKHGWQNLPHGFTDQGMSWESLEHA